jgi:hypothetical protein
MRGLDAEGDEPALAASAAPAPPPREAAVSCDQVVGGKDEQLRVAAVDSARAARRTRSRRRCRARRLEDERAARSRSTSRYSSRVLKKSSRLVTVRTSDAGQARAAQERLLQQALAVGEADEWLGMQLTGDRPKPGARAAAKNGWYQRH